MFQTILAGENENIEQDLINPQLVIKARGKNLQNLQKEIQYEMNFLEKKQSTGYFSMLIQEYKRLQKYYLLKKIEQEMQVNSDMYDTIFQGEKPKEQIEGEINKKLKEEYYKKYILEPEPESPKKKTVFDDDDYEIKISNLNINSKRLKNQNEVNLQDLQIEKMNLLNKQIELYQEQFNQIIDHVQNTKFHIVNSYTCNNDKILDAISPHILNCFAVYADDITEALIDDLLYGEVEFLNHIEKFKANMSDLTTNYDKFQDNLKYERDPQFNIPSNVMKLLKTLDDFATDQYSTYRIGKKI